MNTDIQGCHSGSYPDFESGRAIRNPSELMSLDSGSKAGMTPATLVIAALFFALGVHVSDTKAAGIEVSPARLDISVGSKPIISRIQVKNPTSDVQLYEVSLDTDDSSIAIRPKSFTVQAGGSQEVQLTAQPKQSTEFRGEVQVVGRALAAAGNEIGSGVKLPLSVHYGASGAWYTRSFVLGAMLVLGLCVLGVLGNWLYRKKQVNRG